MALTPLRETVLVPCVAPKPLPAIAIPLPTGPLAGVMLLITGEANETGAANHNMVSTTKAVRRTRIFPLSLFSKNSPGVRP
jgi:hypothetical protein